MSSAIRWGKKYYEELGGKDQDGFYDYAYRYYIYLFYLPDRNRVRVKRYMDTPNECSLFFIDNFYKLIDNKFIETQEVLSAIIAFMRVTQAVSQFYYFNGDYIPINLGNLRDDSKTFSFIEMTVEEYASYFDNDILL
ncbi:MAG: hypothetical protein EOO58_01285 [Hymenobacter sp.]|nr:MAG: hypothetical protein EOO58_01285 [Hymenobacter sp.]